MFAWYSRPLFAFLSQGIAGVLVLIGLIGGWYWFWRKSQEEHFPDWETADAFIFAGLAGVIGARLGYIIFHFSDFGLDLPKWVNLSSSPGLWAFSGLVASFAVLWRFAQKNKVDSWEAWDFYSIFLAWFFAWYWLSRFITGTAGGVATGISWYGFIFPQRLEPAHPVQLYSTFIYALLAKYLIWVESRYRFFFWYRSKKRTARTGYLFSFFLILSGLGSFIIGFLQYPFFSLFGFDLNLFLQILIFVGGCVLLYVRSGRNLWPSKENNKAGNYGPSYPSSNE